MGYSPDAIAAIYPIMEKHEPSTRRGGIFANKSGYHNSRNGNSRYDYSVQCPADRDGDPNAAAAIDITLSDAAMRRVTKRLFKACARKDSRMAPVREVIGTLNGRSVSVWNRVATGNGSRSRTGNIGAASDRSHMWHVHISILRRYTNDTQLMLGIAEVAAGVRAGTYAKGGASNPKPSPKPKPSKGAKVPTGGKRRKVRILTGAKEGGWFWGTKWLNVDKINRNRRKGPGHFARGFWYIQRWLIECGYQEKFGVEATGFWNGKTQRAYNQFRRDIGYRGKDAVGSVGFQSLTKLQEAAAGGSHKNIKKG